MGPWLTYAVAMGLSTPVMKIGLLYFQDISSTNLRRPRAALATQYIAWLTWQTMPQLLQDRTSAVLKHRRACKYAPP